MNENITKHKNTEWKKSYRDSVNLYNELIEKIMKASIEISFNHKKQFYKEASKDKIMP